MEKSEALKNLRKSLKLQTDAEFNRLLDIQHRFDFVDEKEWDEAERLAEEQNQYWILEEMAELCLSIQVTGSMKDYYAKLLCVDSKGGLYICEENDAKTQRWIRFSDVHGSYYEIAIIEEMEKHLK
jgi:hypothetical protein